MDCKCCGGKMVKVKYIEFHDMTDYLKEDFVSPNESIDYSDWLKSLNASDYVLTRFVSQAYEKITHKYYIRIVENKTNKGIKLKGLSKTFNIATGELIYGGKSNISIKNTYKIIPIDDVVDNLIRDYCRNEDDFDIDKLNKIITIELKRS